MIARETGVCLQGMICLHECGGIYLEDAESGEPVGRAGKTRGYFTEKYPDLIAPEPVDGRGWWANQPYEGK